MQSDRRLATQLDDALLQLAAVAALVDGQRQEALAQQVHRPLGRGRGDALGVEAGIAAHLAVVGAVGDQEPDRAVGADLQAEAAGELEAAGERTGQDQELAQEVGDRGRIVVRLEDVVDRAAEPDEAAAQLRALELERAQQVDGGQAGSPAIILQAPFEDRLLDMQPVLGRVEHHRLRAVDDPGGDLVAAMRRQAMQEQGARRRACPSARSSTRNGSSSR